MARVHRRSRLPDVLRRRLARPCLLRSPRTGIHPPQVDPQPKLKGETMQHAELVSHVDTDLDSRAELRALPAPEATRTFKSIPHVELVDMLEIVLQQNQIRIEDERFALRRGGSVLFGVLQLAYGESPDGRAALGLRTANNKTMSIQLCAGLSVFVCDNLAFRGDMIALRRKHTSGLNLRIELAGAVLRFQEHFGRLADEVEPLKERDLPDVEAKAMIHDAFASG